MSSEETKNLDSLKAAEYEAQGDAFLSEGQIEEARAAYLEATVLDPENPIFYEKLLSLPTPEESDWQAEDFVQQMSWTMKKQEIEHPEIRFLHESFTPDYQAVKALILQLFTTDPEKKIELITQIRSFEARAVQPLIDTLLSLDQLAREASEAKSQEIEEVEPAETDEEQI